MKKHEVKLSKKAIRCLAILVKYEEPTDLSKMKSVGKKTVEELVEFGKKYSNFEW